MLCGCAWIDGWWCGRHRRRRCWSCWCYYRKRYMMLMTLYAATLPVFIVASQFPIRNFRFCCRLQSRVRFFFLFFLSFLLLLFPFSFIICSYFYSHSGSCFDDVCNGSCSDDIICIFNLGLGRYTALPFFFHIRFLRVFVFLFFHSIQFHFDSLALVRCYQIQPFQKLLINSVSK